MATPPTRSGGAPLPGPEASADAASLRAYLARDTHARVSRLSADEFTSWLERETLERLHRDRPAALRARADATRRFHRRTLFPLEAAVAAADAAFDASDDRARISAAEKALAQARAAIEGITAHLAREDAVSEPGKGPGGLDCRGSRRGASHSETEKTNENEPKPETVAEKKRAATVARLDAARASLPGLRSTLEASKSASRLYRDREAARAALRDERARTGIDASERDAASAEKNAGFESGELGVAFEETGMHAVARLIRQGRFEVPGMFDDRSETDQDELFILRNVSLGMAFGEIDGALVRVRDAHAAYASSPFQGKKKTSSSSEHLSTVSLEKKEETTSSSPPPVEVLAVFECKRNPDDAHRGFLRRRADLLWLAGDETKNAYDPKRYANKHHPTGHFTRGYHPVRRMEPVMRVDSFGERRDEVLGAADDSEETKRRFPAEVSEKKKKVSAPEGALVVTKASFRRFADGGGGEETNSRGFYFPRLCLVTRPRAMCGLDTKVRVFAFGDSATFFGFCFFLTSPARAEPNRNRLTYLGGASRGSLGILLGERLLHSSAENHQGYAATNSRGCTLARSTFSRPTFFYLLRDGKTLASPLARPKRVSLPTPLFFVFFAWQQVRAPLMQRACARVASHVFETRGEVLSVDAFACEIASLRESVSADPAGARRGALREALAPLREWLAERNETFEEVGEKNSRLAALDDAASVFELYLDAAEGSDPRASGGVVLMDA
jgi:hypothetical protein